MSEPVLIETVDGVATVTLNRPESYNSLNLLAKLLSVQAIGEEEYHRALNDPSSSPA